MKSSPDFLEISPAFIGFLCAYYYFDPGRTFFPFLISALLHEAGHLAVLCLFGAKIYRVNLKAPGAAIVTEPLPWHRELLSAAAGPAVSLTLFLLLLHKNPPFAMVNLCLLLFNLLPFWPLDGGRMLRALLSAAFSDRTVFLTEKIIGGIFFLLLLSGSVWLTCICHAGLWPVLACALLFLRVAWANAEERRFLHLNG